MTLTELLNLWRTRDNRYRTRKQRLTEREVECVTEYRRAEINLLADPVDPMSIVAAHDEVSRWAATA